MDRKESKTPEKAKQQIEKVKWEYPKHIWLDMDETLLYGDPDTFMATGRPYLLEFLAYIFQNFETVNIWTAAGQWWYNRAYAQVLKNTLPEGRQFENVWCGRCTSVIDYNDEYGHEFRDPYYKVKQLKKVWRRFRNMNCHNTLILDNTRRTYERNYGNAIPITDYVGGKEDDELKKLVEYLPKLLPLQSVRYMEKRFWSIT